MSGLSEEEARRIFDHKISICKVLGGDVRKECLSAGIPAGLIEKFLTADGMLTAFLDRHDQAGNPLK